MSGFKVGWTFFTERQNTVKSGHGRITKNSKRVRGIMSRRAAASGLSISKPSVVKSRRD